MPHQYVIFSWYDQLNKYNQFLPGEMVITDELDWVASKLKNVIHTYIHDKTILQYNTFLSIVWFNGAILIYLILMSNFKLCHLFSQNMFCMH